MFRSLSLPVLRDGPVVNREANVVGFAHSDFATKQTRMTSPNALRGFIAGLNPGSTRAEGLTGFQSVKNACVLVVRWSEPPKNEKLYLSQTISNGLSDVRDPWCLSCGGTGFLDCPNCQKGVVTIKKRVLLDYNELRGPLYGNKTFNERCSKCNGRGGFDCPHCQNGKLSVSSNGY